MPDILMVIAPETFRDEEYAVPRHVFEQHGARVVTASAKVGPAVGKLGMVAIAGLQLASADAADYAAIVFVGGSGAQVYFDDPVAHALAHSAFNANKVIGAICIAPSILARAGLLAGRRATAFPSQESDLQLHGAAFTGQRVTVDRPFVTANGPEAAEEFAREIVQLLAV